MRKRLVAIGILILLVAIFIWRKGSFAHGEGSQGGAVSGDASRAASGDAGTAGAGPSLPGKVSQRKAPAQVPTHGAIQLKDFFLPEVDVSGLNLEQALEKLRMAYEEVCGKTREVPLQLAFEVPPGQNKPVRIKLGLRTLDSSVRLLAAAAGMKVTRDGATYRFELPRESGQRVTRTIPVSPDFIARLKEPRDGPWPSLRDALEEFGIDLDASTTVKVTGSKLEFESSSAADELAISGVVDAVVNQRPLQHKLETAVFELAPGTDWTPPEAAELDQMGMQTLADKLGDRAGVTMSAMPSITARDGENATIEMVRDFIVPLDEPATKFETHQFGKVINLKTGVLGLGHQVESNFTDTEGGLDPESLKAVVDKRTEMSGSAYTADAGTQVVVQTRPDGSRTVLVVAPVLIDATGQPVHDKSRR